MIELGKYYLRFAWFPKTLSNGQKIWFESYYEVHLDLPIIDPVYTIRRITAVDYIIETLKGEIVNGRAVKNWEEDAFERMLNAAKSLQKDSDAELY
jgi:hypothetical protein